MSLELMIISNFRFNFHLITKSQKIHVCKVVFTCTCICIDMQSFYLRGRGNTWCCSKL